MRSYRLKQTSIGQHSPGYLNEPVKNIIKSFNCNNLVIADIGCGTGKQCEEFKKSIDAKFIGVDFSPATINYLKTTHIFDELFLCSSDKLPLADKSCKVALSMENMEHLYIDQVYNALSELLRISEYIIITTPFPENCMNIPWITSELQEATNDPEELTEHDYICLESAIHKSTLYPQSMERCGFKLGNVVDSIIYYAKSSEINLSHLQFDGLKRNVYGSFKERYISLLNECLSINFSKRKIIDCFIFYNEVDLLKYRLNILENVVDYFVIVESTRTFTGKPKELYFKKEMFNQNIIHIVVDDFPFLEPTKEQVWKNEKFQRNCITRGLDQLNLNNNDILIFSDVDEIPDPNTLNLLRNFNFDGIYALEQDFYYYNLESRKGNWYYSKITSYRNYVLSGLSIDQIRWSNFNFVQRGGWHLSYFGNTKFIQNKIQNFSHQEYNKPEILENVSFCIENGLDLFSRVGENIKHLPLHLNNYLPPNKEFFTKTVKVIGFCASGYLGERGTVTALFDYAYFNQKINGNKSIIFYDINLNYNAIEKFKKEFEVKTIDKIDDSCLDYFYNIQYNNKPFKCKAKTLTHVVVEIDKKYPLENVATVSQWVKGTDERVPCVPHMINLPKTTEKLKQINGIVFGRYGGFDEFNIPFVHEAIKEILSERNDIYFLFANTKPFYNHPRVIYLELIIDLEDKVKFINSCDAMIHARLEGETFGLSIAEFSSCNKPVITSRSLVDNAHIELLGEKAIIYDSKEQLKQIFLVPKEQLMGDWNAYQDYTPEKVMKKFNQVFLNNDEVKNDEVTIVTAFFDINRSSWDKHSRTSKEYIDSFLNYFLLDYTMIIFIDLLYLKYITELNYKNKTFIIIDSNFLNENIHAWKNIEKDRSIMNSDIYKDFLKERINLGHPENIYPEYNCINHAKIDFLSFALPFIKTDFVCWSDFGYHKAILHNNVSLFPTDTFDISKFNTNKINIFLRNEIKEIDYDPYYTLKYAPEVFTGTFYGLPVNKVREFQELYHKSVDELHNFGISDDDQHVLLRCYYKNPELFELYYSKDKWPEGLNYFQKDNLTTIMNKYGSDKGNGHHNYTLFYETLFKRHEKLSLFELGIGTNNINVPSNMGINGKPGASLYAWREYFPNAMIYGADIDKNILFESNRIKTFYCNQTDKEIIKNMWDSIPEQFDLIIEDGLHTFEANVCFFENSIHKLKKNGYYIIEDIHRSELSLFEKQVKIWEINFPYLEFKIMDIPLNTNKSDNIILKVVSLF